ncbi:MAG: 4Fe-4S binding protein [Spirochaetales bacterium]|nr:4Fe-4S binding protein [Spirochaetales bacterium]
MEKNRHVGEVIVLKAPCRESATAVPEISGNRLLIAGCSFLQKCGGFGQPGKVISVDTSNFIMIDIRNLVMGLYSTKKERESNLIGQLLMHAAILANKQPVKNVNVRPFDKILVYGSGLSGLLAALDIPSTTTLDVIETPGETVSPGFLWETMNHPSIVYRLREKVSERGIIGFIPRDDVMGLERVEKGFILKKKGGGIVEYGAIIFAPERREGENNGDGSLTLSGLYLLLEKNVVCRGTMVFLLENVETTSPEVYGDVMRAALHSKKRDRGEVIVVSNDIHVAFRGGEELYDECRKAGVVFIRPSGDYEALSDGGSFRISGIDAGTGSRLTLDRPEIVVIPQKPVLSETSLHFAAMARLSLPGNRYSQADSLSAIPSETNVKGVFVTGAARENLGFSAMREDIHSCVFAVTAYLAGQAGNIEERIPLIDAEKCVLCLTCIRVCPYNALVTDTEKGIAKIIETACMACGICVSECPARAMQMRNLTTTAIDEGVGLLYPKGTG